MFGMSGRRVAVIDIGSNSGRLVVLQIAERGAFEVIDELRAPLRLARALDHDGRLTTKAFSTTLEVIGDFVALAQGQGATEIRAVGTFAMREATNGPVLAELIRERFGITVEIIDGGREARVGFAGAAYGIDVTDGLSIDIGGGSLQLVCFRDRAPIDAWTFPFGALRLTDRFFANDPPKNGEVRALRKHVRAALVEAGVPQLRAGDALVGTGGTIRNLGKIDLRRERYPLTRLHGYEVERDHVRRLARSLARAESASRVAIPGLNSNRVDSIVAGAIAVDEVMEFTGAPSLHVSGQGLREGLIRSAVSEVLPPPEVVRGASVRSLCRAFYRWSEPHADRRAQLAAVLFDALMPDAEPLLRESLEHAAQVIDVGATIDVYNRYARAADVIVNSDLQGFSHRMLVAIASLLLVAERPGASLKAFRPIVDGLPAQDLAAAATILDLADQVERRSPPTRLGEPGVVVTEGTVEERAPVSRWWRGEDSAPRVLETFGRDLRIASTLA
jgi:exopolyphosphatase/guanosine-5'-triphosphate,3'-diphosphate pyrophosphatase